MSAPADRFDAARSVADAVLYEGYVLYPYRASARKNQVRWQFGVLVPPGYGEDSAEHAHQRTECLMEPRRGARLAVELRFLRAQRRSVQRALPGGAFETVEELELADRVLVPWDEGVEERIALLVPVDGLAPLLPASQPDAGRDVLGLCRYAGHQRGHLLLSP